MDSWFLIGILSVSIVSVILNLAIQKNIDHVAAGYLRVLGRQNKQLVKPRSLFVLRLFYFLAIVLVPIVFYLFLQAYE